MYGLLVLGMLVFLVGVGNLHSVHAQDTGVFVQEPASFLNPVNLKDVPPDFGKLTPTNGATLAGTTVTMTWEKDGSTTDLFYLHCVDKTNNGICDANIYWSDDDNNRTIGNLDPGATYYWQTWACRPVYGCRGANYGEWWSFKVPPVVVKSAGSQDGWVLESSHGSGVGGSLNSTDTTFPLGDDAHNRQYRAILSFNTSGIPDNAVIQSAVLKIHYSGAQSGTNPFTILGPLYVDIRDGYFGSSAYLQTADFNATANATKVAKFGTTAASSWYSATLNSLGRAYIDKTSLTQFRLYFNTATNANNVADYIKFVSGDGVSKPELVITYNVP